MLVYVPVIAFFGVVLTLGVIALVRADPADIPDVVHGIGSWFRGQTSLHRKTRRRDELDGGSKLAISTVTVYLQCQAPQVKLAATC